VTKTEKKRMLTTKRRQERLMQDFLKLEQGYPGHCGHAYCEKLNAATRAVGAALDWALSNGVATEALTGIITRGLVLAMMANRLEPEDVTGQKAAHPGTVN
jgi:hypothetical protein